MGYIDHAFYDAEYKGIKINDQEKFERLNEKASDIIDILTNFVLTRMDFERFAQFIQTNVKKAVAAQIEYMASREGELSVHGDDSLSSVNIGNFSYTEAEGSSKVISPMVYEYLKPTGLLYRGVATHG